MVYSNSPSPNLVPELYFQCYIEVTFHLLHSFLLWSAGRILESEKRRPANEISPLSKNRCLIRPWHCNIYLVRFSHYANSTERWEKAINMAVCYHMSCCYNCSAFVFSHVDLGSTLGRIVVIKFGESNGKLFLLNIQISYRAIGGKGKKKKVMEEWSHFSALVSVHILSSMQEIQLWCKVDLF